ncbi:DgyrCDS5610 [Dimorphilus gyrociliatus]|uniref:DgyrCDS5610 n=1 Tax=Dimorphilus gyrociliatus TaxID=2664684 RepID=A0A7I8VL19_9ANNE|nr:DgyrCDS5610 [Dimorphilus gyrociliatus]
MWQRNLSHILDSFFSGVSVNTGISKEQNNLNLNSFATANFSKNNFDTHSCRISSSSENETDDSDCCPSECESTVESIGFEVENTDDRYVTIAEKIFHKILTEHKGKCSITEMYQLFDGVSQTEVYSTLKKLPYIRLVHQGEKIWVVTFRRSMVICSNYVGTSPCNLQNCQYLHICKNIIMDFCPFGQKCKLNHNIFSVHNKRIFDRESLGSFNAANIKLLIRNSMPKVCENYVQKSCDHIECMDIHICPDLIARGNNHKTDGCKFDHNLYSSNIGNIFESYKLRIPPKYRRRYILAKATARREKGTKKVTKRTRSASKGCKSAMELSSGKFLEWLIVEKKGICSLEAVKTCPYVNIQKIEELFRQCHTRLLLLPLEFKDNCKDVIVKIYYPELKLCADYCKSECSSSNCLKIHVCQAWLNGACDVQNCPKSHNFEEPSTLKLTSRLGLDKNYKISHMICIIQNTFPAVCVSYNSGACIAGENCPYLHICADYMLRRRHSSCQKDHTNSSTSTKRILDYYRLSTSIPLNDSGSVMIPKSLWKQNGTTENAVLTKSQENMDKNFSHMLKLIATESGFAQGVSNTKKKKATFIPNISKEHVSLPKTGSLEELARAQEGHASKYGSTDKNIEDAIIDWLINDCDGKAKVYEVLRQSFCSNLKEPMEWLRTRKSLLLIDGRDHMDNTLQVMMIGCRLCINHLNPKKVCRHKECVFLHLCRDFVMDNCKRRVCKMSHNLSDSHNSNVLNSLNLSKYGDSKIKMIIRNSMPQLCVRYCIDKCDRGSLCPFIHYCPEAFNSQQNDCKCKRNHCLENKHNSKLFEFYRINESYNESMKRRMILYASVLTKTS